MSAVAVRHCKSANDFQGDKDPAPTEEPGPYGHPSHFYANGREDVELLLSTQRTEEQVKGSPLTQRGWKGLEDSI